MNLARIDFPGFVVNTNKAIDMLGGLQTINSVLHSPKPEFKLLLRNNDLLDHPLVSEIEENPCILIRPRVRNHYKTTNGQRKLVHCEIIPEYIGQSLQTHTFNQPCDFQFLPPLSSTLLEKTVENPPQQTFIYLSPRTFMHQYRYTFNDIRHRLFGVQGCDKPKNLGKNDDTWIASMKELIALEHGPGRPPPSRLENPKLVEQLELLFADRPIWTVLAIIDHFALNNITTPEINELNKTDHNFYGSLCAVAYYVNTGPFIWCWVRYGFNPITSIDSAPYQSVTISLRNWDNADEITKRSSNTSFPTGVSHACAIPKQLNYTLQLLDIPDAFVQNMIHQTEPELDVVTGWYEDELFSSIRLFIQTKLERMLSPKYQNQNPAIIMADIVIPEDLNAYLNTPKGFDEEEDNVYEYEELYSEEDMLETLPMTKPNLVGKYVPPPPTPRINKIIPQIFSGADSLFNILQNPKPINLAQLIRCLPQTPDDKNYYFFN
jgi:hypothetical protein